METRLAWQQPESLRKQSDKERRLGMGTNQRVTETDRRTTGGRTALGLCLICPSAPSINAYAIVSAFTKPNQ